MKAVSVMIRGRVQGVGYRWSCYREAQSRGLAGWVQNADDGSVRAVFRGEATHVDQMVGWCRIGPRHARVTEVAVTGLHDAEEFQEFEIR